MGTVVNRPGKWVDLCQGLKMPENPAIWSAVAMLDHFEKIQKLKDKIEGVPNFRRVPGYKVYCCGQPTKEGFAAAIEKACGDKWPKDGPIIWLNMRQEAIVYVNGNPVCARPPNKIGEYAELGAITRATTGCVIACLFKEFQISASFEGLVETVPGVNASQLKTDNYKMGMKKDPLFRGEFEVVKEVLATLKDGVGAKNNADKIIDLNGTKKTGGTGIKQLRENIAESKLSYEIMDDAA